MERQHATAESERSERSGRSHRRSDGAAGGHVSAWRLDRAVGNIAAGALAQTKLAIGAPGDRYEQEADRVAEQVVSGSGASSMTADGGGVVRRSCAACSGGGAPCPKCDEEEKVRRMPAPPAITPIIQRAEAAEPEEEPEEMVQSKESPGAAPAMTSRSEGMVNAVRGGGSPMAPDVRAYMEPRFGRDFGGVRVHTDDRAAASAKSIGALAYTIGRDVVFGAGMYNPGSREGKRLLAHELTHVVQQGSAGPMGLVQRQTPPAAAPVCPTRVTFSHDDPIHVPACGNQSLRATTDGTSPAWTLEPNPTAVDAGTTIAANGTITIGASQAAGSIKAVATVTRPDGSTCNWERGFRIRSHPTGIADTVIDSLAPGGGVDYGAVFEHTFISNDGQVASLDDVGVGERFIGVPTPTAATHAIVSPANPFGGTFTLNTATLNAGAVSNWHLTPTGNLGGTHDTVTISRANINVGRFIQSTSNPTPPNGTLPATMTLIQGLHWHCSTQSTNNGWTAAPFVRVAHSRTLRAVSGDVHFVTTVNGLEVIETYSGAVGVFNVTASPVSTPHSAPGAVPPTPAPTPGTPPPGGTPGTPGPGGTPGTPAPPPAPVAKTVRITADTLPTSVPSTALLSFAIRGNALGCTIAPDPSDLHAATVVIGQTAGTITVRVADATGVNFSDVSIVIT